MVRMDVEEAKKDCRTARGTPDKGDRDGARGQDRSRWRYCQGTTGLNSCRYLLHQSEFDTIVPFFSALVQDAVNGIETDTLGASGSQLLYAEVVVEGILQH
jgi:hypothetical protein